MITEAKIVSTNIFLSRIPPHEPPHGDPLRILTGRDIVAFGESPLRWQMTEPDIDLPRVTPRELGYAAALSGEPRHHCFVRRPDTMDALRNTCPRCGSRSRAKVCRTCGVARRNEVAKVPFSIAVPECAQWLKGHEDQDRVTLTGRTFDAGTNIAASLLSDPLAGDIKACSDHLVLVRGTWHDLPSGTDIPVEAMLDLVPRAGSEWDQCLVSLDVTADATPNEWARRAQVRGLHVRAALAQMLHAAATGEPRPKHLWLLVETGGGHMTARRQASAEMLNSGRAALQSLMTAYATCLATRQWPAFDPPDQGRVNAFTEVHLEPWMIDSKTGSASYFAIAATRAAAESVSRKETESAHAA